MPVLLMLVSFEAFNLADEVALDVTDCVLADDAVLAPLVQILSVEVSVKRFCQ